MLSTQPIFQKNSAPPKLGKSLVHQSTTLPERGRLPVLSCQAVTTHGGYFKGRVGPHFAPSAVAVLAIAEGREGKRYFGAFVIKGEI